MPPSERPTQRWWATARMAMLCALVLELALRFLGNPTHVRSGPLELAARRCHTSVLVNAPAGADTVVRSCSNALGLRGALPQDEDLRIVALGSSTTYGIWLNEEDTWPDMLQRALQYRYPHTWVGNAGVNGNTTVGDALMLQHIVLPLRPRVVLLLPGANDRGKRDPAPPVGLLAPSQDPWWERMAKRSAMVRQLIHLIKNDRQEVITLDAPVTMPEHATPETLSLHHTLQANYRARVEAMADSCIQHGALPVLITHPLPHAEANAAWEVMEVYNGTLRALAEARRIPLIDLAQEMPPGQENYLDGLHFSRTGTQRITAILLPSMEAILDTIR